MDPWLFGLTLVFGFGGILASRYSNAPHLFTLFGGICLILAGLSTYVDEGISLPQALTNATITTDYDYNPSVNYTGAHYECINASYYPTNAYMYENGTAYCAAGDTLITTYCDEFPIVQTVESTTETVYYVKAWDYWVQALSLMLALIGVAFVISMSGGDKVTR
jgi:hypothetical protein